MMASSVVENGGGSLEGEIGATYSDVLQGTVKLDSKPIFFRARSCELMGN